MPAAAECRRAPARHPHLIPPGGRSTPRQAGDGPSTSRWGMQGVCIGLHRGIRCRACVQTSRHDCSGMRRSDIDDNVPGTLHDNCTQTFYLIKGQNIIRGG